MFATIVPMGSDLSGGFATAWAKITGAIPGLTSLLNMVGVILVAYAIGKWLWDRKRGGGGGGGGQGGGQALLVMLVIGALCTLPGIVFPILLKFADWAIDLGVQLFQQ